MRTLRLECRLDAPVEKLWPELLAIETHAAPHRSVRTARVVSGAVNGQAGERVTEWALLLRGSPLQWSQVETVDPVARSVEFRLRHGDPRYLAGSWALRPDGDATVAEIAIEVDFGLPRISAVFDVLLAETLTDVLRDIARSAGDAARLPGGRPALHESEAS